MNSLESDKKTLILHRVKFTILLSSQIPAVLLTLFMFTFFLKHRNQMKIHQNQGLLVLLCVNFIALTADLPMPISFYYTGFVHPATPAYCKWWTYFEYSLNLISELLMAFICIQRHIFIFQPHLFSSRIKRFTMHYLPILFCLIYPFIFYLIIIVFDTCDGTQWVYSSNVCGYANCYLVYDRILSTCAWLFNNALPTIIIFLANTILIVRVMKQKRRRQQAIPWKKQRLMTLQLLGVSSLYLIAWIPSFIAGFGQRIISPTFLLQVQFDYLLDIIYIVCLYLPWMCCRSLPDCNKWIWKTVSLKKLMQNTVVPTRQTQGRIQTIF
jgi:hypothetical protein